MRSARVWKNGLMVCTALAVAIAGVAAVGAPRERVNRKLKAQNGPVVSNRAPAGHVTQNAKKTNQLAEKQEKVNVVPVDFRVVVDQIATAGYPAEQTRQALSDIQTAIKNGNKQPNLPFLGKQLENALIASRGEVSTQGDGGVAGGSNEDCPQATPISCGGSVLDIDMTAAGGFTSQYGAASIPCTGFTAAGPDVVYSFSVGSPMTVTVNMADVNVFDAALYVVTDCSNINGSCVAGSDLCVPACAGGEESVTFAAAASTTYFIIADAFTTTPGAGSNFDLTVTCAAPGVCGDGNVDPGEQCDDGGTMNGDGCDSMCQFELPGNEACGGAEVIPSVPFSDTFDNNLSLSGSPGGSCNTSLTTMQNDLWYSWTPGSGCEATLTVDPTTYDGIVVVHTGTCGSLTELDCGDEPEPIELTWVASGGTTYFIQIGDWGGSEGGGPTDLDLVCVALGTCGDGTIGAGEECDDSNMVSNDGCSSTCQFEGACCKADGTCLPNLSDTDCATSGGTYQGDEVSCMDVSCPVCGNGTLDAGEGCDDGNLMNGDGCDASCLCEPIVGIPANNDCANRDPISDGNHCFDNTMATTDGIVEAVCDFAVGDDNVHNDIWYNYTATCTGVLVIDTCGGGAFDTRLAVYSGFSCPPAGAPIDCDDDDDDATNLCGGTLESVLLIPVTMGDMLKIRVGEFSATSTSGSDLLNIDCQNPICGNGSLEIGEECDDGNVANNDGCSSTCTLEGACCLPDGTCLDNQSESVCTGLPGVYQGDEVACVDVTCPVCGNGTIEAGEECDDSNTMNGDGCDSTCQNEPAANDDCIDRTDVFDGPNAYTLVGSSLDAGAPVPCDANMTNDVWFNYLATCNGFATIGTCDALGSDTTLQVYNGCNCGGLVDFAPVACADDNCGGPPAFSSTVDVPVTLGSCYKIRVGGWNGGEPTGTLTISCTTPVCGNGTQEAGEECDDSNLVAGDGCDATCQVEGACCVGTSCQQLSDIGCAAAMGGYQGDAVVCGAQCAFGRCCFADGACSEVAAGCCADQGGTFTGGETCTPNECPQPPLVNDDCIDRVTINDGVTAFSTLGATTDGPTHVSCMFDGQTYADVWYNYTATCNGTLTVSTCGTVDYDSDVVLYDGWDCGALEDPPLSCNDDGAGCAGFSSSATATVTVGQQIKIRIGGFADETDAGTGTVSITCGGGGGGCDVMCDVGKTPEGEADCGLPEDTTNGGCNGVGTGGGSSTCCSEQATGGCDDATCEAAVCACDSFCCDTQWDASCAGAGFVPGCGAAILCPVLCPPPALPFGSISCGEEICGTGAFDGASRDTDWYEITLATEMQLTWSATAEFDLVVGIVDTGGVPDCNLATALNPFATAAPCTEASITACLAPGTYWFFVAADFTDIVACGAEYNASLTCGSCPTGACCGAAPACTCSVQSEANCLAAGGVYKGDGVACMPGAGGTCDCNANGVCDQLDFLPSGGVVKEEIYTPSLAITDCDDLVADVFDTDTQTFTSGCGPVVDLDVALDITHTWVGDLVVDLTHVGSGTTARLISRIGLAEVDPLCSGGECCGNGSDNMDIILDDEAATSIEAVAVTPNGVFQPSPGALSVFDGLEKCSMWTLTVHDAFGGDIGTLNSWSLRFVNVPQIPAVSDDCNANGTPDECELGDDCNDNGIPDECDLVGNDIIPPGGDGIPDDCNCLEDADCASGDCDECLLTCIEGTPCVSVLNCLNDFDNNACNAVVCMGTCQYDCIRFGDVATPQNNIVNLDDILCVLSGFSNPANCIDADIAPCGGNGIINLDDILAVLNAFSGANPCGCDAGGSSPLCGSNQP